MKTVIIIIKIILFTVISTSCTVEKNKISVNKNQFIIQDSLIQNFDTYKSKIYFGYEKDDNKSIDSNWKDCIHIYHIQNNGDTIYFAIIPFYRKQEEAQGSYLKNNSSDMLSFVLTTVAGNATFSENIFKYIPLQKQYFFEKRVYNLKIENSWERFDIPIQINVNKIDSIFMNKIFTEEETISNSYE